MCNTVCLLSDCSVCVYLSSAHGCTLSRLQAGNTTTVWTEKQQLERRRETCFITDSISQTNWKEARMMSDQLKIFAKLFFFFLFFTRLVDLRNKNTILKDNWMKVDTNVQLSANQQHESKSGNEAVFSMETNRPMEKLHPGRCQQHWKKRRRKNPHCLSVPYSCSYVPTRKIILIWVSGLTPPLLT